MNVLVHVTLAGTILVGISRIESAESIGISESGSEGIAVVDSVPSNGTMVDSVLIAEIERDMVLFRNLDLISELELFTNYDLLNDEEFDVSVSTANEIETKSGE